MTANQPLTALVIAVALASNAAPPQVKAALPVIMVQNGEMPQTVPQDLWRKADSVAANIDKLTAADNAVGIYHALRSDFSISHTEMAKWLGLKRRTLYNWMKSPERSSTYGPQIENRLSSLIELRNEMEPEHRELLYKIAFSPIYGDPDFGVAILGGSSSEELAAWYDKLFSQFESYRSAVSGNELMG